MTAIRGTTVLITGAASGIGYLVGRRLLDAGAARLLVWAVQADAMQRVVAELVAAGHRADGFRVDMSDRAQIARTAAEMHARGIAVDILVNNAGIVVGKSFVEHSADDIARTMDINSLGPMYLARELLPGMIGRGRGHIVNISSAAAMISNPLMSVYCSSKWALAGWSDSLRLEMEQARTGVRVTTVMPYYIDTGMFAGVRSRIIPLLQPDHVAGRIVEAIEQDRVFLRMPRLLDLLPFLRGIMPTRVFDKVAGEWFGVYRAMRTFKGRG